MAPSNNRAAAATSAATKNVNELYPGLSLVETDGTRRIIQVVRNFTRFEITTNDNVIHTYRPGDRVRIH